MTRRALQADPRTILLIKPSAIGDVVHTLPILKLLRDRFPQSHISWLLTPACAGLLEGHPLLDEIILFERKRLGASWRSTSAARDLLGLAKELRGRAFDLVIDLQGLFRSGLFTRISGAPVRVGFANAREWAWLGYTHRIAVSTMEQHAIERYLTLAESLGCPRGPVDFVFATDERDRQFVRNLLGSDDPYAVLVPGTNWPTKRWPIEYFKAMVKPLQDRFGLRSIAAGAPGEIDLAGMIDGSLNLAGKTNLRQLTALLEGANLVICNDSGPMHIAAALGKPMVAAFGPTNPVRTGPYLRADAIIRIDIPCSPCYSRTCSHQSCLKWLSIDAVLKQAATQLGQD